MSEEITTEEVIEQGVGPYLTDEELGEMEASNNEAIPDQRKEYDGSYFPTSFLPILHDLKKCVELFKNKSGHDRSLHLGAASLVESLDQAIRWATNIEDIEADIKKKAKK